MAFRKNIVDQIDGYYFDEQINWTEDYDFDARVRKANLSIGYDDSARVVHPALSLYGDLKSSYNYGKGQARGVQLGKEWYAPPERIFKNMIKSWTPLKNKFGTGVAAYLAFMADFLFLGFKKESKATERGVKRMAQQIQQYDNISSVYDKLIPEPDGLFDFYTSFAKEGVSILDIGCGSGRLAFQLAQNGAIVHAIDISAGMIETAKKKLAQCDRKSSERVHFEVADIKDFHCVSRFDYVFMSGGVFEYLLTPKDQAEALQR